MTWVSRFVSKIEGRPNSCRRWVAVGPEPEGLKPEISMENFVFIGVLLHFVGTHFSASLEFRPLTIGFAAALSPNALS